MKKRYIKLMVLVSLALSSCEGEYLDVVPDNVATIDNAFTDRFNARKFLYTLYSFIPAPGSLGENVALNGGDEVWYNESRRDDGGFPIARGLQNTVNTVGNRWSGGNNFYIAIRNCNIFISRIDEVGGMTEFEKTQWKAEAQFLKGYFSFLLIRMYGPIVINKELIPVSESAEAIGLERSDIDTCFLHVLDLMSQAIPNLPSTIQFPTEDLGRVTKPAAAAIKAQVAITYASPLFNGNTVYVNMKDSKGNNLFPQQYDASKWAQAATATNEAIDIAHAAGHRLYSTNDYQNILPQSDYTILKAALRGRVTDEWNAELLWGHTGATPQRASCPRWYSYITNPVESYHAPTLRMAETYYTENGVPIDEDINFNFANRYLLGQATDAEKYQIEPGETTALLHFNREPRFYADISFDRGVWFGNGAEDSDEDPWYVHNKRGEYSSIFEISQFSITGYFPKKLVNIKTTVRNGRNYGERRYPFPLMRLANLYLYHAEALNESKSAPDAEVYEFVDKIRERAGLNGVIESWSNNSNIPNKPTTKEGMRDIIQHERLIEMAFEGERFWDLRRWKLSKSLMNKPIRGWNVTLGGLDEYYTVTTIHNQTFTERDYFWPIPEGEIINNPKLIQNLGW